MGKRTGRPKGKKSFEQQVRDLDEHFVEEVLMASPEKLGDKLIALTKYRIELEEQKENDIDLKRAKEEAAEAGKVYSEGFKAIKMKQKYIFNLLSSQGTIDRIGNSDVTKALKDLKKSLGDGAELTISTSDGKTTTEVTL